MERRSIKADESLTVIEMDKPKSTLVSRNITVLGRRTSVRLEPEMWKALREIARREKCKIHDICSMIHIRKNENTSLTAAIRVFLMLYYRASSTEEGHRAAGHGDFSSMMQRARLSHAQLLAEGKHVGVSGTGLNGRVVVTGTGHTSV